MEVIQTFPSFQSLFLAVESGVGIALFGKQTIGGNASPQIHYVPLVDEDCCYEHGLVWDRKKPESEHRLLPDFSGHSPSTGHDAKGRESVYQGFSS